MTDLRNELDKAFGEEGNDEEEQSPIETIEAEESKDGYTPPESTIDNAETVGKTVDPVEPIEQRLAVEEAVDDKAPASWTPKLKETWKDIPKEVQTQILKREKDITSSLNSGSEHRKQGEAFNELVKPYQAIMAAEGVTNPMDAVKGLFDTVSMLRGGSPQQKAAKMAEMIGHYNIDVTALDNALTGNTNVDPQQTKLEQMLEQKLAPVNQLLNQANTAQQQQAQQVQQDADKSITDFAAKNEYFENVRGDMANIMDAATANKQPMTLEKAYQIACNLNPEISQILQQRQSDQHILGGKQQIANKQYAASSINGNQVGGGQQQPQDLRGNLLAAWDNNIHG